jgi:hypothetical protein
MGTLQTAVQAAMRFACLILVVSIASVAMQAQSLEVSLSPISPTGADYPARDNGAAPLGALRFDVSGGQVQCCLPNFLQAPSWVGSRRGAHPAPSGGAAVASARPIAVAINAASSSSRWLRAPEQPTRQPDRLAEHRRRMAERDDR